MLTIEEKRELVALGQERERRKKRRTLFSYTPYPKQLEFHEQGAVVRERLLMAGNQLGKTYSAAYECAMHLTGLYPGRREIFYPTERQLLKQLEDTDSGSAEHARLVGFLENLERDGLFGADLYPDGWRGRRWEKPIWAWAAGETGESTRDNPQRLLLGPPALREEWGTGAIPGTKIRAVSRMPQPTNAVDLVSVEHVSSGTSVLQFKSYSQGREKWQGPSIDLIWLDEEPPMEIYMEALTRTNATKGGTMITFTPLLGMSQVVRLFIATEDDLKKHEE